ncbi:helix-turn-helix domain-containing protein [Plebeiibacterium marinum]|uniref:Helix-turn-helix domain-containing protein n=1 Tax=Plebeiibacterium marinum TaxID=2992111 RepID=A0AAE3MA32_9BACT|nr:helix-turn-helix domain-containing protein [Plebeiobacterium marinum]MCW3804011.1 helix-turn-helix domain-containing protein [Plebeiobacterium marinum]
MAWIYLLAITELSFFLNSIGLFRDYTLLFAFICDTHVVHGTLFYFYAKSFTHADFKFKYRHTINLLPFILIFGLKLYFNKVLGVMDCYGAGCLHEGNEYVDLLSFLKFGFIGIYLFLGWHAVHDKTVHKKGKDTLEKIRANWIKNVSIGVMIIFFFSSGYKVLHRLGFDILGNDVTVINLMVSFFILVFLYMGNSYAYIFVAPYQGKGVDLDKGKKSIETLSSQTGDDLNIDNIDQKFKLIEKYLIQEKPYLKGQFTVRELSDSIQIPQIEISQIIQTKSNKYYADYINEFRVQALKEKLDNPANDSFTILSIALDCGFASKSSLNRIFKHHTGITPTEYRNIKQGMG